MIGLLRRNRDFRALFLAQIVSFCGDWFATVAMLGLVIDRSTLRPALGNGGGGVSGRAIHPIAVRAVHDVRAAHPDLAIVGVGGVASGWDAAELMLVGAAAVQVGTASFADPSACRRVLCELVAWASDNGIARLSNLSGVV